MDAYSRFQKIMGRWVRFVGLCAGHDLLSPGFAPNLFTIIRTLLVITFPFLYVYTIIFVGGDHPMAAIGMMGTGCKVYIYWSVPNQQTNQVCNVRFLLLGFRESHFRTDFTSKGH